MIGFLKHDIMTPGTRPEARHVSHAFRHDSRMSHMEFAMFCLVCASPARSFHVAETLNLILFSTHLNPSMPTGLLQSREVSHQIQISRIITLMSLLLLTPDDGIFLSNRRV